MQSVTTNIVTARNILSRNDQCLYRMLRNFPRVAGIFAGAPGIESV